MANFCYESENLLDVFFSLPVINLKIGKSTSELGNVSVMLCLITA